MLILWSGGCDSTLLLLQNAMKENCRALSVEHSQIPAVKQSRSARERIKREMKRRGLRFEHGTASISYANVFAKPNDGLSQPQIWIQAAQACLGKDEDLLVGWIRGDDVWHYRDVIFGIFERLQTITDKTGRLLTPLEWMRKTEVIKQLREAEMYEHCWWCEGNGSSDLACGSCVACTTHADALAAIERERRWLLGTPEKPKKKTGRR